MTTHGIAIPHHKTAFVMSFEESGLDGVGQTAQFVALMRYSKAVDQPIISIGSVRKISVGKQVFYIEECSVPIKTRVSSFKQYLELCTPFTPIGQTNRTDDSHTRTIGIRSSHSYHILYRMFLYLLSAHRRIGTSDTPEQQTQIIIYLCRCTYRTARITRIYFLFHCDSRRKPMYPVAFWFGHLAEKLARIGRQALHIPPLPLGIQSIECERRFA